MKFADAYAHLKKGELITLHEWAGYWYWKWNTETNSIDMYCKDGSVMDIRETKDIDYTLSFIVNRDDWEVKDKGDIKPLDIHTFGFGEAIRRMKQGEKVRLNSWENNEYIYIDSDNHQIIYCQSFYKTNEVNFNTEDILSTDWVVYDNNEENKGGN